MFQSFFQVKGATKILKRLLKSLMNGSVAEWSKAMVYCTSLLGGVGSNPTTANLHLFQQLYYFFIREHMWQNIEINRSWQDSNLRSQRESDFKSDALTARPQLLTMAIICF
jgi:hypothetical protein